jgi:hypothetical protein
MLKPTPLFCIVAFLVTSCGISEGGFFKRKPAAGGESVLVQRPGSNAMRPTLRPTPESALPTNGITVEAAAKTSPAALADATKPIIRPEQDKGLTIAALGLLDRDGFWLRTPLVSAEAKGRVVVEATGASVNVVLLPNGGEAGAGSQISIAAMQVLAIPITALTEIRVFIR